MVEHPSWGCASCALIGGPPCPAHGPGQAASRPLPLSPEDIAAVAATIDSAAFAALVEGFKAKPLDAPTAPAWEHDGKPYESFLIQFQRLANGLAARYGGRVYLVGGAVTQEKPRDYDVRIVVPDAGFDLMFGDRLKETTEVKRTIGNQWFPADWARGYDNLKQSRIMSGYMRRNLDVQVQSESEAALFADKPRVRMDAATDAFLMAGLPPLEAK